MYSSIIWSVYVQKENKIHRGISEILSVQTIINNQAKSPKLPFFENSLKLPILRYLKIIRSASISVLSICERKIKFIRESPRARRYKLPSIITLSLQNHHFSKNRQNYNFWDFSTIIRLSTASLYFRSMWKRKETKSHEGKPRSCPYKVEPKVSTDRRTGGLIIYKSGANLKLEGQWPWIPRELQQFVDAGWSVFTIINFGNNKLFCE